MGRPAFDLQGSPSLRLAQRIACSSFSLSILGGQYVSGSSCWKKIEPRLAALRPKAANGSSPLTAKSFRDAWRLRHRLQSANIDAMVAYGCGPSYLPRLARLERVTASDLRRDEYVPTLLSAALALEWMRPESKATILAAKRRRAVQVIDRVLARWKPARNRSIHLPAFEFPGLMQHQAAAFTASRKPKVGLKARLEDIARHLAAQSFRVSPTTATHYPSTDPYRAVDYLLHLALDESPLTDPALLRWAMDLVAVVLATEALFICDAGHADFATFHRKRADAVLGLAQIFFCDGTTHDAPRQQRIGELVSLLDPALSPARRLAFSTACVVALTKFRAAMRGWGVDLGWFRQLWKDAHGKLPADGFSRLGRPPRYVQSRELRWEALQAAAFRTPPESADDVADDLGDPVESLDDAIDQLQREGVLTRRRAQRTKSSLRLVGRKVRDLQTFGKKYVPRYSMSKSDYEDLAERVSMSQGELERALRRPGMASPRSTRAERRDAAGHSEKQRA